MSRPPQRRYPYTPIAELLGGTRRHQARRLNVPLSHVDAYVRRGLSLAQADQLAVRAGTHPSLLWPTWFEDALRQAS